MPYIELVSALDSLDVIAGFSSDAVPAVHDIITLSEQDYEVTARYWESEGEVHGTDSNRLVVELIVRKVP